ncbi:MAG: hypothetical protein ACP5XB_02225 [Isosphaeraceae bacterium]
MRQYPGFCSARVSDPADGGFGGKHGLFVARGASAVVHAEVIHLTSEVLKMMLVSKLKVTTLLLLVLTGAGGGLIWNASGAVGWRQQGKPEAARPVQKPPPQVKQPAAPKWAHLTTDDGHQSWVRLEDGRSLTKSEGYAGLYDPASMTLLSYRGNGPIERRNFRGRDVGSRLEGWGVTPLDPAEMRRRMTEEGRRVEGGNFKSDAQVVDLDGRRCLRIDMSRPDSLGKLRLSEQTWYDVETRRPIRRRRILQYGLQVKYKREFDTTTITYGDSGPADIYALGVPAGTPIVDAETLNKVEFAPALQEAFNGAARLIERLPRSVRIIEDERTMLNLTYWSAPERSLRAWAAFVRDHDNAKLLEAGTPRSFSADAQDPFGVKLPPNLRTGPKDDLPADALAAWLPFDKSVNVHLRDGTRQYSLTRFITAPGKPKNIRVHVHPDWFGTVPPEWVRTIWPFAFDGSQYVKLVPPEPGTPKGWVAIKLEYPRELSRDQRLYYADPAHGYAVSQVINWESEKGALRKYRTESALRWAQLPGGAWYVTAWEWLDHIDKFGASCKPEAKQQRDHTTFRRVAITPMPPDKFPPGLFDGEKLLEAARKEGAKIQVD